MSTMSSAPEVSTSRTKPFGLPPQRTTSGRSAWSRAAAATNSTAVSDAAPHGDEQDVGGLGLRVRDARLLLDDADHVDPGVVEDRLDRPRVDHVVDGDERANR